MSEEPRPADSGDAAHAGRRRVRWGRVAIVTLAVVFAVVASAVAYVGIKLNNSVASIQRDEALLPSGSRPPSATPSIPATYAPMNILLIGSDYRPKEGERSDTFIVVHISADRKSVYLISFPRDMYVTIPGYGKAKINAAFSYGKSALAVKTIESMTGARIDHVMVTDFSKFTDLIDTIGPITVDNPAGSKRAADERGVYYTFPKGPLTITDGHMALAFVRQRMELANGDLDRTLRQRAFLKALALKLGTPDVLGNPAKLTSIVDTMSKYVVVDAQLSNEAIYSLALSLSSITSADQIHMIMAPILGFDVVGAEDIDVVDTAGVTALGKALQTDTMPAFVAKWPSTEYGRSPSATPSTQRSGGPSTTKPATPTKTKT